MAPNTDYEYGVDLDRSDHPASGIRYIGRSEMVEFVCYGEDTDKPTRKPKTNEKFARVKSPRMRTKIVEEDAVGVRPSSSKTKKRTVSFNLNESEIYPTFDNILPPIETKPSANEKRTTSGGSNSPRYLKQKSRSMDEATMTKLVPLDSPRSPKTSPKISRKASLRQKSDTLSIDNLKSATRGPSAGQSRWERGDSMLKKRNSLDSINTSNESLKVLSDKPRSPRSLPSSPRSPRSPPSPRNKRDEFLDLDNIDEYKPDKSRLKFIQAALSATTSPRFIRPGSGKSSVSSSGRSSPVSLGAISIDSDNTSRTSCTFPELDRDSFSSRPSSPLTSPPNSRVSTAAGRSITRSWSKTKAELQDTITSLLSKSKGKWYD